jgi:hypothetical protein
MIDRKEQRLEELGVPQLRRLRSYYEDRTGTLLDEATYDVRTTREAWRMKRQFSALMSVRGRIGELLQSMESREVREVVIR